MLMQAPEAPVILPFRNTNRDALRTRTAPSCVGLFVLTTVMPSTTTSEAVTTMP